MTNCHRIAARIRGRPRADVVFCALGAVVILGIAGCQPSVPVEGPVAKASSAPTDGGPEGVDASADVAASDHGEHSWPTEKTAPTVVIKAPANDAVVSTPHIMLTGTVADETALASATVKVGHNVALPLEWIAETGALDVKLAIPLGSHKIVVRAQDVAGNSGEASVLVTRSPVGADNTPPVINIDSPKPGFAVFGEKILVSGSTVDDTGVIDVRVQVGAAVPQFVQTDDGFKTFWAEVSVSGTGTQVVRVLARDTSGKTSSKSVTGASNKVFDTTPPTTSIGSPAPGFSTPDDAVEVKGSTSDASGVAAVDLRVGKGPYQPVTDTKAAGGPFAGWKTVAKLQPGPNTVTVRGRDKTGIVGLHTFTITNTTASTWSKPRTITLRWKPPAKPKVTFTLDRAGLSALFPPEKARQIVMLYLDVRPMVAATFKQIRNACGGGWAKTNTSTKSCPKSWGQPEINVWRLVTMTPANVNVKGTSIESMANIAKGLSQYNLLENFSKILAAGLGIGLYDLIVGEKAVSEAMVDDVIATHPNATKDGRIPVTLEDALTDLSSMGKRFDAVGGHPGFLDKNNPPFSVVMTKSYSQTMSATSNLAWHDGVRLSGKEPIKSYAAFVIDTLGPTFDDVLEFEFNDPKAYTVTGLAAKPTSKMTFRVTEHTSWAKAGTSRYPLPKGNGSAWKLKPWTLEYVLTDAAYRDYKTLRRGCSYCKGKSSGALLFESLFGLDVAEITVGRQGYRKSGSGGPSHFSAINPNPAGWMRIWTLLGLGSPPKPQYVWDMISEVSQRRLLDGGIKQGQGNARFALPSVPVGITSADIVKSLGPELHKQRSKLSALLMGKQTQNEALDFWLARGKDKELRLHFVAKGDPVPTAQNSHAKRGFFADSKLTKKVSKVAAGSSGDALHEKISVGDAPKTVFAQNSSGAVHRIQVIKTVGDEVTLVVRRWIGGGQP